MTNKGNIKATEDTMIQGLLGNYLRFRSASAVIDNKQHLDEDSLTAFVEGNLSERESTPLLSHLVDCSFCRHVTAELVKLDFAFADEAMPVALAAKSEPTSVSDVLSNLLSRIFGTSAEGSAVLAHQEPEENKEEEKEESKEV